MRKYSTALLLFVVLLGAGCAIGNRHDYADVVADVKASGNSSIRVATHDQRSYVVSGTKLPQFVGLQRGGYGNPFNVSTSTNKPLADDITAAITTSLARKGFRTIPVIVSRADSKEAVLKKAQAAGAERSLIVTLSEWKSDTYTSVALVYDATMMVFDNEGQKLAEKKIEGRDNLGGSMWNPPSHARQAVPAAFKQKLEELLNDPDILRAVTK